MSRTTSKANQASHAVLASFADAPAASRRERWTKGHREGKHLPSHTQRVLSFVSRRGAVPERPLHDSEGT